jgi:hypothetical protein
LKKAGAAKFGSWTAANINQYIGVVLNDEVKSIAFIKSQIFDEGEISGRFTKYSAEDLALVLRAGALPAPVRLIEEKVDKAARKTQRVFLYQQRDGVGTITLNDPIANAIAALVYHELTDFLRS